MSSYIATDEIHGYPRAHAHRTVSCLREFRFDTPDLVPEFLKILIELSEWIAPLRTDAIMNIDSVTFKYCYPRSIEEIVNGSPAAVISLNDPKVNMRSGGSSKDQNDFDNLP